MEKKILLTTVFVSMLLLLTVTGTPLINSVEANFTPLPELPPPIYIRSDGSVDPSAAPLHRVGDTYTFIGNINNTIEVQRPNIVLDGNGFVLTKPAVNTEGLMIPIGWLPGVHIVGMNNVIIRNITFDGCITGVTVENSSSVTISQNRIRETSSGIVVLSSFDINIISNNISLFATGIHFMPSNPQASNPYRIKIEGNQIIGDSDQVPSSPPQPEQYGIWGGFTDSQMIGNNFSRIKGIALYYSGSNNLIRGNNFQENYEGIFFLSQNCVNSTIYGNNFNHNSENAVIPFIRDPPLNFWDNGTVGNFWSDYNGTDSNGDGIGDTPYIIETVYYDYDLGKNVTVHEGQDNFPLMSPLNIDIITIELPDWTITPISPTDSQSEPEVFPIRLAVAVAVVVAAVVLVAAVGVGLSAYLKKTQVVTRKRVCDV